MAEDSLKSFTRSKVRTKILLCLKDGDKSTSDLEKEMGIRNTTILHAIKEMTDSDLVARTDKGYGLTNLGKMQAYMLTDMIDFVLILERYGDFWLTHNISAIPESLLVRIGMLSKSEILEGDPADILKTQEFFISELKGSTMIRGLSPIIIPGYAEAVATAVMNGAEVDLILTKPIMDIVIKEHSELLKQLLEASNFRLYRIDMDVTAAFTVTDSLFSLGLFRIDGGYDVGKDLNCVGEDAIAWGNELFNYYLFKSTRIESI
ncbi:MAG TPA: winged helix-turn-helix domain-containing protein [Methanothrix sp.]|nr:winged helix-turn-helix domain-containing protein [Methanothrix sp.]HPR67430.1 winged helix-turn-helix domain-containing protein [Methanothrix sp.]